MKLKGSCEALMSYKFISNFHFTDQNLYRPELQKILQNITFELISLCVDDFFSSNLLLKQ